VPRTFSATLSPWEEDPLSKYRRLPVALVAACLTAGLAAGPAAAASSDGPALASAAAKKERKAPSVKSRVAQSSTELRRVRETVARLEQVTNANQGAVAFLTAAAPQLVNGLTQLRDASLQLKGGLETLGAAYTSVEYGAIRVYSSPAGQENWKEIEGAVLTSADIPDDGNTAFVSGSLPFQATGATDIKITGIIRTNEQEPGVSHGEMGGVLYAKCIQPPVPAVDPGACDTPAGANTLPSGSLACAPIGPPDERSFSIPGGTTDQSLTSVGIGVGRTDSGRPTSRDPSPTGNDDEVCTLPGPGVYEITTAVIFSDIPDTRTPSPRE
jgi:hypothetical protein